MKAASPLKCLAAVIACVALSACIHTEPRLTAPHINLSPATVFTSHTNETDLVLDFGIEVSANESDSLENLEALPGVRVRRVTDNGSAAAAELKAGDIILAVNGVDTNNPDTFIALLNDAKPDQAVSVKARRDTTVFTTQLAGQTRTQADIQELYRADPIMSRAGYRTVTVAADSKNLTGARIVELFAKSPLPAAGLKVDDTILTADSYAVESAQGLINYLMSKDYGDTVAVQFVDADNILQSKSIKLWDPGRRLSQFSLWPFFSYRNDLSPSTTKFSLLDLWIISLFKYERQGNERNYRLFTLFKFGTGTGELVEDDVEP